MDDPIGAELVGCGCLAFISFIVLAINVALAIWVFRDAKARGMDMPVLWVIVVLISTVIGLIVYLVVRPTGNLTGCPNCHNKRLEVSATCPHCGNA